MSVDKDLATLRRRLQFKSDMAALARAEAELSRLRDERNEAMDAVGLPRTASLDDLIRHHRGNAATAAGFDQIAAEARCARLQQALEWIIDYVPAGFVSPMDDEDSMNYRAVAREALAGPDTPADCEHDYVFEQGSLSLYRCDKCGQESYDGVFPRVGNYPLPADSQEDKT
jgi:hypothetical protein